MDQFFEQMTEDIIGHPLFQQLRLCTHHGGENSLYVHSVDTARCACRLALYFHLTEERVRAVTRAALLHDFFGYDWHSDDYKQTLRRYRGWHRVKQMHAFAHGKRAARRADRFFSLDERQRSAIISHMFPLAPVPRNSEAWILTLADKVVASREVSATVGLYMRRWCRKVLPAVHHREGRRSWSA